MKKSITIVQTGVANTASVVAAIERLDREPRFAATIRDIEDAELLILPGVGSFSKGMEALDEQALTGPLFERIHAGRPTFAICLGLQLLCLSSEEGPGAKGLGILPAEVQRFPDSVRVPQLGWNTIQASPECQVLESGSVYFANSYRLARLEDPTWLTAKAEYGGDFIAAVERGPVVACQFHPELSGPLGLRILNRWMSAGENR